jgi:hypothetical protein
VAAVAAAVDKANGCSFATLAGSSPYPPEFLYGSAAGPDLAGGYQERYVEAGGGVPAGLADVVERLAALDEAREEGEEGEEEVEEGEEGGGTSDEGAEGSEGEREQREHEGRQQEGRREGQRQQQQLEGGD